MDRREQGDDRLNALVQLLLGSGLVTREEFARASELSESESLPLVKAVTRTSLLTEESMSLAVSAQEKVLAGEISSDLAIRALRIAMQRKLSLDEAIASVKKLHQQTHVTVSVTNELTNLLLAAKFISLAELGRFIKLSADSGMMIGHLLLLDNIVSTEELLSVLDFILMTREDGLSKNNAAQSLRYGRQKGIPFEQALFELNFMQNLKVKGIRLGELFLVAGLISKEDLAECFEIELLKNKSFGQILLERGLVSSLQVQSATTLMLYVNEGKLKPCQAALALSRIVKDGMEIDSAVATLLSDNQGDENGSFVDLLVEAGAAAREVIDQALPRSLSGWIEQGTALIDARILRKETVVAALRLKSLIGLGYVPKDKAVEILNCCLSENTTVEAAMDILHVIAPARAQWAWVKGHVKPA